jgi:hypothetical protein
LCAGAFVEGVIHMKRFAASGFAVFAVVWLTIAVAPSSCGGTNKNQDAQENHLRERQFITSGVHALDVGEDCSVGGRGACASDLCLHVSPNARDAYLCSTACDYDEECPREWVCRSIYPGPASSFCFPPRTWEAKKAIKRPPGQHRTPIVGAGPITRPPDAGSGDGGQH